MREKSRFDLDVPPSIPGGRIRSLVWRSDDLFDPIGGERVIRLGGEQSKPPFGPYAYAFDRAIGCPGGCHVAMYTSRQTTGLILGPQRSQRQINRHYYYASGYEYPVALGRLTDGRELVAHCPEKYARIEIELIDSGQRLTNREPATFDFFHSRLEFSPDGRYLLSAGWFWHPWDAVHVYDVSAALSDPRSLDTAGTMRSRSVAAELASATFSDDDTLIISTVPESERLDDPEHDPNALGPLELASWSMSASEWKTRTQLQVPAGGLMAAGSSHVVSFH